jgi:hypothetical protein
MIATLQNILLKRKMNDDLASVAISCMAPPFVAQSDHMSRGQLYRGKPVDPVAIRRRPWVSLHLADF